MRCRQPAPNSLAFLTSTKDRYMLWFQFGPAAAGMLGGFALGVLTCILLARRRAGAVAPGLRVDERREDLATRLEAFKDIIDAAGIGTFFWDLKSDTVRWSGHHYTIFDWPVAAPDAPVSHAMFRDRLHPDDVAAVDAAIGDALRDGTGYQLRFRLCLPNARIRHVHGSGRVIFHKDGTPAGINGAVIDVSQAAEAQHATRQRELDFAAFAANLPDVVGRFDRERRCLSMSPRIEALTGYAPGYFVGKRFDEPGMEPLLARRWDAVLEDVVRNKRAREFDYGYTDQYGKERFFITRVFPSIDQDGNVDTVMTVSTDHTERERDARRVRADGVQLQEADVRKNAYLATLAHELRGPLAPISSAAQLIKFSRDRDVRSRAREVIERQVKQLAHLVDDLMEVGRISSGKLEIDHEPVVLQHVLTQAIESVQPAFRQKEQPLSWTAPEEPVWIKGDALRLIQVFGNLLTNASKYSPAQAPVSIRCHIDGQTATIDVCDQGIGLAAASIDDVFGLFTQVHATGIHAQGGLGIGLNLVKQLVGLHGGTVSAASEGLDKGSCFTVVLPRMDAPADAAPAAAEDTSTAGALHVLVVDDNVDGATTLALLLEALGHTSVLAFNGLDGVALAASEPIDMAFLDLGLPDISGIQVALRIRGSARGRRLPLIALTGLGRDEDRGMTSAARFDEHLTKPLDIADLLRLTRDVANRRDAAAGANTPAA